MSRSILCRPHTPSANTSRQTRSVPSPFAERRVSALLVVSRMRLAGVRLVSNHQPERIRVDNTPRDRRRRRSGNTGKRFVVSFPRNSRSACPPPNASRWLGVPTSRARTSTTRARELTTSECRQIVQRNAPQFPKSSSPRRAGPPSGPGGRRPTTLLP
jgi:hypothetical protein